MSKNKKYRRLKYLIHKYDIYCHRYHKEELIDHLNQMIEYNKYDSTECKKRFSAFSELKSIVLELNISKEEYFTISAKELNRKIVFMIC
jgi:hypothetical protein